MIRNDLRNIAIIAHVDHGKTTLVDEMLKQSGTFRENQAVEERIMDSNDIEKERGITILAKNTSIHYKDIKINVIDTPGHADFSGEVERVLKMVSGVLLLVDAAEGPMPQTRFVMQKALELNLKVIIVVNKIDRPDARLSLVEDEILELFLELDASDDHLRSPIIYCSARRGTATKDYKVPTEDLSVLFDTIINYIEPPEGDPSGELQLLVSSIDYNDFVGRIGIGRIERGVVTVNGEVAICNYHGEMQPYKGKIVSLYQIEGLKKTPIQTAKVGDIVCFSGIESINIGDTITSVNAIEPVAFVKITEPTVEMFFYVNDSPLAGREGKFVTTRHLKDRLFREMLRDVSLKVYMTDSADAYRVCGRGEMHLSVLIENMRRGGYEFQVGTPRVIYKEVNGEKQEPIDKLIVDVPEDRVGYIFDKMGARKGELLKMTSAGSRMRLEFLIPSRGLFGYRSEFLTDTSGEGVMNTIFHDYGPFKGEVNRRSGGSLIAFESGEAVTYGLHNAQDRGVLFIESGTQVYEGMVVGVSPKGDDMAVNVCKKKHVTNMRASGSDEALRLNSIRRMSLEEAIEFIKDDELLEVTPLNIRIRKRILLNDLRMKSISKLKEKG
ncbi:MAG: translational GTPase TypA [Clostridiales bacterium]|jgi:GTP-binding protein|nr:translational GTPase TypA [Clostridiales bacterium]